MPLTFVGVLSILILLLSLKAQKSFVVYSFACAGLLQASAAFFVGGSGITPANFLILSLLAACLRQPSTASLAKLLSFPSAGFCLLLLAAYSLLSAVFFPHLFLGLTNVNAISDGATSTSFLNPPPLAPSMGNLTQSVYVVGAFSVFFMMLLLCDREQDYDILIRSLTIYAVGNVIFGCLDILTYYSGTAYFFDFIRNSNYVFHTDETASLGLKRISGSFTETSAFSAVTLACFAFTARLSLGGIAKYYMAALSCAEVILLACSTSSTALAGLPIVVGYLWILSILRLFRRRFRVAEITFSVLLPLFVTALVCLVWLNEPAYIAVSSMLNSVLFEKSNSLSGVERLAFNAQAMSNFFDTNGFGAGLGSMRASSFVLALLGSVGVIGTILMSLFLLQILFSRAAGELQTRHQTFRAAARAGCFASLVGSSISGTSMDLGLMFFLFAAAAYWPTARVYNQRTLAQGRDRAAYTRRHGALDKAAPVIFAGMRQSSL